MFTSQKRVIPRWKEWKPLATQQFRLRSVVQIIGLNIGSEDLEGKICGTSVDNDCMPAVSYYYTLHLTAMSAPFYTSEKLDSDCPKWKEIDANMWVNSEVFGGIQGFVLRVWCHSVGSDWDRVLTVWGVHLTGLVHLGTHLGGGILPYAPNTVIFLMPGGFYTNPGSVQDPQKYRVTSLNVPKEDLRLSYTVSMVHKTSSVQQAIVQRAAGVSAIKQKITSGDYLTSDHRGSAMLRRLLNKNKPKSNHLDVMKLKESVEVARFRLRTLQEERSRALARLTADQARLEVLADGNQLKESRTMEKYRLLQREVQAHRDWLVGHVQRREAQLHAKALLNFRIKQLISELQFIYPVEQVGDKYTICGVHLPDSESLIGCDELQVSVGLGFVAHTVQMISVFLQVPLRYPVIHVGSRSRIVDLIADKMPETEREFPLFCKGKDKLQFNYAVYLLNKNVAGLRWLCGLTTHDLRCTLPNLTALLRLSGVERSVEPAVRSPTSSTVDLGSSSFSIPSPVQSSFPPRPFPHRYRASESAVDSGSARRISASAGPLHSMVQKDGHKAEERSVLETAVSLTNNFSYSLDKGLNELEELKRKSEWLNTEAALSSVIPMGGSESSLVMHGALDEPGKPTLCAASEAAKSTFLQNWEADKNNVIFSDEDSDHNNTGIFIEKTICSLEAEHSLRDSEADGARRRDSDRVSVALEACDDTAAAESGQGGVETSCQSNEVIVEETDAESSCQERVDGVAVESGGDLLLDNVTDRTEALASHATSFNMFRSRFRSTLGSTN